MILPVFFLITHQNFEFKLNANYLIYYTKI